MEVYYYYLLISTFTLLLPQQKSAVLCLVLSPSLYVLKLFGDFQVKSQSMQSVVHVSLLEECTLALASASSLH